MNSSSMVYLEDSQQLVEFNSFQLTTHTTLASGHNHITYDNQSTRLILKRRQKIKALCGHIVSIDIGKGFKKINKQKINDIFISQSHREPQMKDYCTICLKNALW